MAKPAAELPNLPLWSPAQHISNHRISTSILVIIDPVAPARGIDKCIDMGTDLRAHVQWAYGRTATGAHKPTGLRAYGPMGQQKKTMVADSAT